MIVSAFHCRDESPEMLRRKIEVSLRYVDRLLVILDRWPEGEAIAVEAANNKGGGAWGAATSPELLSALASARVRILHDRPADPARVSGLDEWGRPMCEEGRLRQIAWMWCVSQKPKWIVLGDTDEILTPDAIDFFRRPPEDDGTDVYLCDIINLWGAPENGDQAYIGGDNIYSPHCKDSHKRRAIVRYRPGSTYSPFPDKTHHVHPAPDLRNGEPIKTKRIPRGTPHVRVIHYKWFDLDKWRANPQSKTEKYRGYLAGVEGCLETVPRSWLW